MDNAKTKPNKQIAKPVCVYSYFLFIYLCVLAAYLKSLAMQMLMLPFVGRKRQFPGSPLLDSHLLSFVQLHLTFSNPSREVLCFLQCLWSFNLTS